MQNYIVARIIKTQINMTEDGLSFFLSESFNTLSTYYENCDSIINFPGTQNPLLANIFINTIRDMNLEFQVFYHHDKISDVEAFQKDTVLPFCKNINSFTCKAIGDFKICNILSLLPNREDKELINPMKYFPLSNNAINLDTYNLSRDSVYITDRGTVASISHLKN